MNASPPLWSRRIHEPFVLAALAIALTTGFGYAALLAAAAGMRVSLGAAFGALVRAHGHAQLFGWMGLFILGVGLYFMPRLRSVTLKRSELARGAFWPLVGGIVLYTLALPALAFVDAAALGPPALALSAVVLLAVLLQVAALFRIGIMFAATERAAPPLTSGAPSYPVIWLIRLAAVSMPLAVVLNALWAIGTMTGWIAETSSAWDSAIITLWLYGVALPVAFVFAVRNLPLYLRLAPPPRTELRPFAAVYALGLALRLAPDMAGMQSQQDAAVSMLGEAGAALQALCVLLFLWRLDLMHRRPPWTVDRAPNTRPDLDYLRKPTRKNYPDYGEFGRFELLIYSAFGWLALSAMMTLLRAGALLARASSPLPLDAERHAFTVGFVTLLIFGMAARMLPGFSGKRRVASPRLVLATFLLGNLAAGLRVLPLLFIGAPLSLALYGVSGAVGWLAVAALAVNLWRTFRLEKQKNRLA